MSRWSASTFVTTATVGVSARNERSYSSASTTKSSVAARSGGCPPHAAHARHRRAGRDRARRRRAPRWSSPSWWSCRACRRSPTSVAAARRLAERLGAADDGNAELARAHELRMVLRHRRRDDERARAVDVRGSWPVSTRMPSAAEVRRVRRACASQPVTRTPRRAKSSASALMPAPAMPTKWMGRGSAGSRRQVMTAAQYRPPRGSVSRANLL